MAKFSKLTLAALGGAALLAGCATGPYYDNYGYPYGYNNPYYGSTYDPYYYGAPSVGFGFSYSDSDYYRDGRYRGHWRDRDGRWHNRNGDPVPNPNDTRQWIDRSQDQVGGPNTDRRRGESGG